MAKRKRKPGRAGASRPAAGAPPQPRKPEPRPHFHYERRPGYGGDYEIQLTLADAPDGGQAIVARIRAPGGEPFELTRRALGPNHPRLVSDAAQSFGVPAGLEPTILEDILWECRSWAHRDNARRRAERE
ncbi:MAG: hypothetical protein NTW86_00020 [Candidatus Sumerlaeota bacterium]|nr:hypothetical protein [Candidatus Sumerlaeota bacterium]